MDIKKFVAEKMEEFDSRFPGFGSVVTLKDYPTREIWEKYAKEKNFTFEEAKKINRLLKAELEKRGVMVNVETMGTQLSFIVGGGKDNPIAWAVLESK